MDYDSSVIGMMLVGSEGPTREIVAPYLSDIAWVVAADSGFDLALELGIRPDLVVGDFDSITNKQQLAKFPPDRVQIARTDKNLTDAEIALEALIDFGCSTIFVAGGGGGRFDHQLSILGLFERDPRMKLWLTSSEHIEAIDSEACFRGHQNCTISFFPLTSTVTLLSSCGLRWPLDGLRFKRGSGSISNVVIAEEWKVNVHSGRVLMIRNLAILPIP